MPVHFRETVGTVDGETRMTFDYVLRPGVAPTTNALLLLDAMGIRDPSLAGGSATDPGADSPSDTAVPDSSV